MATNMLNDLEPGKARSDNGMEEQQKSAEGIDPSTKSKSKLSKPKVGSYTQLLRQHQKKSPRDVVRSKLVSLCRGKIAWVLSVICM